MNLGLKELDGDNEVDTAEKHEAVKNPQAENRFKKKSVAPDLEMRM